MAKRNTKKGSSAVHNYTQADEAQGSGSAPVLSDAGVASNFQGGAHAANPTVEIKPGVFGEGFVKSG